MRSNFKRLGYYIRPSHEFNVGMEVKELQGISNNKYFQRSHTNTIGIDLETYRVVRTGQFAYNRATTRNGDKISIALREGEDCIVSPSYRIFEVIDENELLSEYLMMWFRRPEFDRYARFKSHGSAHEFFEWEQMCDVELPVPHIDKQREIVKEYRTVVNRIDLNNQLIQKLEETAQAIYKQWFVDFEFPDAEGKSYKSNGGEMEESELGEIPKGWKVVPIKKFCKEMKSGGTPSRDNEKYWNSNDVPWLKTGEINNNIITSAEEYISNAGLIDSSAKVLPVDTVLMAMYGVTAGQIAYLKFPSTTNQACCAMICHKVNEAAYLYYYLLVNQNYISGLAIGGAQPNLSKALIENLLIIQPTGSIINNDLLKNGINFREKLTKENSCLNQMRELLLSKLTTIEDSVPEEELATIEN